MASTAWIPTEVLCKVGYFEWSPATLDLADDNGLGCELLPGSFVGSSPPQAASDAPLATLLRGSTARVQPRRRMRAPLARPEQQWVAVV